MSNFRELLPKILVTTLVLSITFLIPVFVQLYFLERNNQNATNTTTQNVSGPLVLFRIDSLPPESVTVGSNFQYQVVWKYNGIEQVTITVENKPDWLAWDSQAYTFTGVVPSDISQFRIKFTAKAGELVDTQDVSVQVKKEEVQSVSTPIATQASIPVITSPSSPAPSETPENSNNSSNVINSEDPFHPKIESTTIVTPTIKPTNQSVLGASTEISKSENSEQNYFFLGILITVVFVSSLLLLFLLRKQEKGREVFKTQTGLVIHSDNGKDN